VSAETRAALEAALARRKEWVPRDGFDHGHDLDAAIRIAARAHLASERSEAVEALERVREGAQNLAGQWSPGPAICVVAMVTEATVRRLGQRAAENIRRGRWGDRAIAGQCCHGHPWTEASTYAHPKGSRVCRVCTREAQQRYRARRAARSKGNVSVMPTDAEIRERAAQIVHPLEPCRGKVCARCGKCESCGKMTWPTHLDNCACPNPAAEHVFCPSCRAILLAARLAQTPDPGLRPPEAG